MDGIPFLSIVIPAYNEASRLPLTLQKINEYVGEARFPVEVLVVENGSTDATTQVAEHFAKRYSYLKVLHSIKGKGSAVREGMLAAQGSYRFMVDADLSMPIHELNKFLPPIRSGFDVAIASREVKGTHRYNEPWQRHLMGRVFNAAVQVTVVRGIADTQCGFKCFRDTVADDIFTQQTLSGWGFDVELLAIALEHGHGVIEVPINWYYDGDSRISSFSDSITMVQELLAIRANQRAGLYRPYKSESPSLQSEAVSPSASVFDQCP